MVVLERKVISILMLEAPEHLPRDCIEYSYLNTTIRESEYIHKPMIGMFALQLRAFLNFGIALTSDQVSPTKRTTPQE